MVKKSTGEKKSLSTKKTLIMQTKTKQDNMHTIKKTRKIFKKLEKNKKK